MSREIAYLALGANMGDRVGNLREAVRLLVENGACRVLSASSFYETKPVGVEDQPEFVNAVVRIETTLSPHDLLNLCLSIEKTMGRKRTMMWGPRVIDIDILLYSSVYTCDDDLVIPHPRMMERAFVLVPLAEITPDLELEGGVTAREAADGTASEGVRRLDEETWVE